MLLQDFTGVPCVVDLAAMRDALRDMGADPKRANPLIPADLVIDHSVQVDQFGSSGAFDFNALLEFQRNQERYAFLRWGQKAFQDFRVVPPDTGIVHQVNLEYLAPVVFTDRKQSPVLAYPDTLVGTDSHTTMINGLGVVGWGVGGIEAEACMLGQPISMLLPEVVGFKLKGRLAEGCTATDLVLTVTQMLRKKGVVGKFVEFYGPGVAALPLADARPSATWRPNTAPPSASSPSIIRRSIICGSPIARRNKSRWWKLTPRRRGCSSLRTPPIPNIPTRWNSIWRPSFLPWPVPSGRRIASIFRM